jgi:hypothetical protein
MTYIFAKPVFWLLIAVLGFIAVCFAVIGLCMAWERLSRPLDRAKPVRPEENAVAEKAIGQTQKPCVARSASATATRQSVTYDKRFALIDSEGHHRYAQLLNGTYQVGKDRRATPSELRSFARAILVEGHGGRFTRSDGSKHGILGYGGRSREARGYILDPVIAAQIGVAPRG